MQALAKGSHGFTFFLWAEGHSSLDVDSEANGSLVHFSPLEMHKRGFEIEWRHCDLAGAQQAVVISSTLGGTITVWCH